ncbi:hypothetical protein BDV93DRAFT_517494 [Ceratobasidium sp. AG-I]|nr:hypothetical protein BDV93DRAFT_517494 [Ceratobasidium sp. AG-I]
MTFVIVLLALLGGFTCFYMLYWRRRASPHPKPQIFVSRTGTAYVGTYSPSGERTERQKRQRILEQLRQEQESHRERETNVGVWRVEERSQGGVNPPKYSSAVEDIRVSQQEVVEVLAHATIRVPPPAYNPKEIRTSTPGS